MALRDVERLGKWVLEGTVGGTRGAAAREFSKDFIAALHAAKNDPRRNSTVVPGDNRWLRVFDHRRIRLLLNLNFLHVGEPDDDRICWVVGVMQKPPD